MTDQQEIQALREKIDKLDSELLHLIATRAQVALSIKHAKGKAPIYRPDREAEILAKIASENSSVLPDTSIQSIFGEIIAACRNAESRLRISYLGPAGSYSHEAAVKLVGSSSEYVPAPSISEALRLVESGESDVCLLPIENSSEGPVVETHKVIGATRLTIMREIRLPIRHCLLSAGKELAGIKQVYAHPQSLGQCRNWLRTHLPHAGLVAQPSNSRAAEVAAREPAGAAIAGAYAAKVYGLHVLSHAINDDPENETRFILLGTTPCGPTGDDKTSLVCVLENTPGSLHKALGSFADRDINLIRIASQPIRPNEYAFYIDLDGHQSQEHVAAALRQLDKVAKQLINLGSYPKAGV